MNNLNSLDPVTLAWLYDDRGLSIARYGANLDRLAADNKRGIANLTQIARELEALPDWDNNEAIEAWRRARS